MNEAILFPGQGAQFSGMGRSWCQAFPAAAEVFQRADRLLGFSLSEACWNQGEAVHRTDVAQPGILTTSVAIMSVLAERGHKLAEAPAVAGLSLGEYTALWAAGSLNFEDALRLVRLRGQAMQSASERIPSGMISLMGATEAQATILAALGAKRGICSVANLNAPGQIVVSGELAALDEVEARAGEQGVRRARRLVVAGGFHSECMRPAAQQLAEALKGVRIAAPKVPFVTNVTGDFVEDPERIRAFLADQVCAPVRWEASMLRLIAAGNKRFLEPGPGEVLAGLLRKISKEAEVRNVAEPEQLG
jgi:[acyl-carrier-protein] S-malonyltransferase